MRYDGPKATVRDLTALGVRQAEAWCRRCDRREMLDLMRFRPETVFVEIRPRLVCQECGRVDAVELSPDWRDYRPTGRL